MANGRAGRARGNGRQRGTGDGEVPAGDGGAVGAVPGDPYPLTRAYRERGEWNPLWDSLQSLDPEFIEAYLAFRSVPHRRGPLPPWVKELILIAVNVATTHLYAPGARRHMQNALRQGATPAEILETIQLTTVLGIHAVNMAVPIFCEEVERFRAEGGATPTPRAEAPPRGGAGRT